MEYQALRKTVTLVDFYADRFIISDSYDFCE